MNNASSRWHDLDQLLDRVLDGLHSKEDSRQLNDILRTDVNACRRYVAYMKLHGRLTWGEGRGSGDEGRGMAGSPAIDLPVGAAVEHPVGTAVELPSGQWPRTPNPEAPIPPIVLDLSSTTHYPLPTSHFSVGSWAFSYMVATVIMGVMLLGFWAYEITHHQHIAEAPSQSAPSDARTEMVFVGRITGMVDVQWSDDPRYLPPLGFAHVPLDRKYILDSGLLEITYDSGAKVILQGPCSYEVESTAGGYLALGKLTAKVAKKRSEVRGQRSDHYPLSTTHYPLFSVRTPTALITDLGTEFGVEVSEDGLSEFRVFQGAVEVAALRNGKAVGQPRKLVEGQAARVFWDGDGDASSPNARIVVAGRTDSRGFVRALPAPVFCTHQLGLVGEFTAAKDDLMGAGQPTLAKIELNSGKTMYASSVLQLNDGDVYHEWKNTKTTTTFNPFDGAVVTVTLNTDLHPRGYDIRSIVSLTGSGDRRGQDRSSQKFDVAYSSVDDPDVFIPLRCDKGATVNRVSHGWQELQATLACRAEDAPIARGVAKLRFVFHDTDSKDPESMYREIDVFGSPTGERVEGR